MQGVLEFALFFILSGFVLAYSNEATAFTKRRIGWFLVNRFARVYPAYLLGVILQTPVLLSEQVT